MQQSWQADVPAEFVQGAARCGERQHQPPQSSPVHVSCPHFARLRLSRWSPRPRGATYRCSFGCWKRTLHCFSAQDRCVERLLWSQQDTGSGVRNMRYRREIRAPGLLPQPCCNSVTPCCCPSPLTQLRPLTALSSQQDKTPLHFAARNGHFDVAHALLEKGAAAEAKDRVRKSALQPSATCPSLSHSQGDERWFAPPAALSGRHTLPSGRARDRTEAQSSGSSSVCALLPVLPLTCPTGPIAPASALRSSNGLPCTMRQSTAT